MDSFKKMDWECSRNGCFNEIKRLDFGAFFDCWPQKISMSDVDGICEIDGAFLMLESKESGRPLGYAMGRLLFQFCCMPRCVGFCAWGNLRAREVDRIEVFCDAQRVMVEPADFTTLHRFFCRFSALAQSGAKHFAISKFLQDA